jgi:hypothetical protein
MFTGHYLFSEELKKDCIKAIRIRKNEILKKRQKKECS